jgi:hypothetical protein
MSPVRPTRRQWGAAGEIACDVLRAVGERQPALAAVRVMFQYVVAFVLLHCVRSARRARSCCWPCSARCLLRGERDSAITISRSFV